MMSARFLLYPLLALFFTFLACSSQDEPGGDYINPDDLPAERPAQLIETDHLGDDLYFGHLNYSTAVLGNGDVLLNDYSQAIILKMSSEGELIEQVAGEGRGPGEIQDASELNTDPDGNLVIYDQLNNKVVRYRADGAPPEEFTPEVSENYRLRRVYALHEENHFLVFQWMPSAIMEGSSEPVNRLLVYDRETESYISDETFPDQQTARLIVDDQMRGAAPVPYSPEFLYSFSTDRNHIYASWTETNEITKLTIDFDTLRTIHVPLSKERLAQSEIDSLEEWTLSNRHQNQWETIEEKLPKYKVSFDRLMVDHLDRIWLKLTRQSTDQEWIILSGDGEPLKLVKLPQEGRLTHISEHHLGFRENDYTFSLYETVE
jgi:hypothetical protein